jgi:hypothetical protein
MASIKLDTIAKRESLGASTVLNADIPQSEVSANRQRLGSTQTAHEQAEKSPLDGQDVTRQNTGYVRGRVKREPRHTEYISSYPSEGLSKIDLMSDVESEHILD